MSIKIQPEKKVSTNYGDVPKFVTDSAALDFLTREMQSIMGRAKVEWCLFVIVYICKNGNINLKIYDQYEYD